MSEKSASPGYEAAYHARNAFIQRQFSGRIVIKGSELPWEQSRQGRLKWYLNPHVFTDTALQDWFVFIHDVQTHSGRHRHQGGIVLYVLEGKGYTILEGKKVEWEEGDLILLPFAPGGVEHQHFNREPGKGCKWLAFIYLPQHDYVGSGLDQKEDAPAS